MRFFALAALRITVAVNVIHKWFSGGVVEWGVILESRFHRDEGSRRYPYTKRFFSRFHRDQNDSKGSNSSSLGLRMTAKEVILRHWGSE